MARYLLLHGFGGAGGSFRQFRTLLPSGCEVFAPNLTGHGAGSVINTFEEEVERLQKLLVRDPPVGDPWHVLGYSMGGRLALGLAVSEMRRTTDSSSAGLIERVTLVGANPGLSDAADRAQRRAADDVWAELIEREGVGAFLELWRALPLFGTQQGLAEARLTEQRSITLGHDCQQLARAMRIFSLGRMPDFGTALEQLRVSPPAASSNIGFHWIAGSMDPKFTDLARRWASVTEGRFVSVEGVGHNVVLEAPEALAEIMTSAN